MEYKIKEKVEPKQNASVEEILNSIEKPEDIVVTTEDEDKFFGSVMKSTMYSDVVDAMAGRMKITFRDRSGEELNKIITMVSNDVVKTEAEFEFKLRLYHLIYALCEIKYYDKAGKLESEEKLKDLNFDEKLEHVQKYSSQKFISVIKSMDKFNLKLDKLSEMASKKNS